jgi:WD40 repeat protein
LTNLVSVYRGVLLYGDSGSGKSSLVNAGLIPEAIRLGFAPERLRVQPRASEELVVERILGAEDNQEELLPSALASDEESSPRTVLAMEAFEERVRAAGERHRLLLIFDQFEEIVTLFDEAGTRDGQRRLVELLVRLLRGSLPIKVLFSFREDYLGRVKELLSACPELIDQALRITPPAAQALPTIIRGPFDRYPDRFARELSPALTDRLVTVLAERFGTGDISLSEVQTVCLRLWRSDSPEALLAEKGPQGLLEDDLGEALDRMPAPLRAAAIALLTQMVTSGGTRNVISAGDLVQRVREQEAIAPNQLELALEDLSQSRLVRRERRRDLDLYEITSEFLVPWISRRRDTFRRSQERRRERRRLSIVISIATAFVVAAAIIGVLAWQARSDAERAKGEAEVAAADARTATAFALSSAAQADAEKGPDVALLLSLAALAPYGGGPAAPTVARSDMIQALETTRLGGMVGILHGDTGPVDSVAFSPDGRTLASGSADGTARLWDVATRKQQGSAVTASTLPVTSVAFSPDGKTLATGGDYSTVQLWDLATHRLAARLDVRSDTDVAFSPDGRILAAASPNGTIQLWDVATGRLVVSLLAANASSVTSVAFSPDGRILAAASQDGTVRLWDVATGRPVGPPLTADASSATSVAFSPDGHNLAVGGQDGTVRLWDPATGKLLGSLAGDAGSVDSVAFSPDDRTLASGSADGTVEIWDLTTAGQLGSALTANTSAGSYTSGVFSPNGQLLATAREGIVELRDVATGRPVAVLLTGGPGSGVTSIAFRPDGRILATASHDGTVQLWDIATRRPVGAPLAANSNIGFYTSVAFSPDGQTLAVGGEDGVVELWGLATVNQLPIPLTAIAGPVTNLAFSPDGQTLAVGGVDGTVQLWDLYSDKSLGLLAGDAGPVTSVAFSLDGGVLASASEDGTVRVWDVTTGRQLGLPLTGDTGPVTSVAFSADGSVLASASEDGTARLWDVTTGRQLGLPLNASAGPLITVAFNDGGRTLAAASSNGTTRVWPDFLWENFSELSNQVCGMVGTGLSRTEWALYAPGIAYQDNCP